MKTKLLALLLLMAMLLTLAGCAAADGAYTGGAAGGAGGAGGGALMAPSEGGDASFDGGEENEIKDPLTIPAGQLTAAEWNDHEHYALWLAQFEQGQTLEDNGVFYFYVQENKVWNLPYAGMLPVLVQKEGVAVSGARVELLQEENVMYSAVTDAKGLAFVFGNEQDFASYAVRVSCGGEPVVVSLADATLTEGVLAVDVATAVEKQNVIELMFLIDTTGSMGDELSYIKAEVDDVIARVKEANPGVTVRLALLFYRDEVKKGQEQNDDYVTRYFDFTEDIEAQRENLNRQKPYGGGDYPEAIHTALAEAVSQNWSEGNSTKLIFHIADAPIHEIQQDADLYRDAILMAAKKGIRIIPVASSGVNKETEYLFRSEALLTGGTYTFLTDDSGIGNSHLEPTVGAFTVEFLNSMLVRLICEFHTGEDIPPVDWRQETK